jgi:hypothetical protein
MRLTTFALIALTLGTGVLTAQPDVVTAREIRDGVGNLVHTTPRQEARSIVSDSMGRIWTIGVESDGEEERNATRQFLTIARFEDVHWTPVLQVTSPGYVFSPAAASDNRGGLWLAWAEFDQGARNWFVRAAYFNNGTLVEGPRRIGSGNGPELRPAIVVEPDGNPLVVFEAGENQQFALHAAKYSHGRWQEETITATDSNFRPFLTLDRQGRTWLAWDRFTAGDYDVVLRSRENGAWKPEVLFFASDKDEQRPTLRVDAQNTVWVLAGDRLAGIRGNQRIELQQPLRERFDEFQIDAAGRFWFFRSVGNLNPAGANRMIMAVWDGKSRSAKTLEMPIGYRAPIFDARNSLWLTTTTAVYRLAESIPSTSPPIEVRTSSSLAESKQPAAPPSGRPHETIQVGGETYTLFFGEMHTHLTEHPSDRLIELWPDRYYLKAAWSGVLDFASASDHDWRYMTASKYKVLQAYVSVLNSDREFVAFSGYEWSGDNYRRRRFGDRTIIFSRDYSPIFRITDPESDTPWKLHPLLQSIDAIDWAHHVGAPFAVMDWTTHDAVVEPVMEMVSGHGVYETYDRPNAVPVWLTKPPIGKTSIQDGLGMGKRFGLVGSSDSHSGISGYSNGMLGIYAKSLTRDSIMEAFRARRTFAVRGGEPLLLDLRVNGSFMGREVELSGPPRLAVHVRTHSPIDKVEIVRDGRYIYTHPGGGSKEAKFEYRDTEKGNYYYVRVWLHGGKYAWSSPVWPK